jgi:ribosomal protein L11 methyltransferase
LTRLFPALDIAEADDLVLAALDDFSPTAIEERDAGIRVFFATREHRDQAREQLTGRQVTAVPVDVPDDDWAARSQQNLTPITVGRITIVPDAASRIPADTRSASTDPQSPIPAPDAAPDAGSPAIVIEPSMGFGTGHHATTRLCLAAMQTLDLRGSVVLDVGTGSGILAIASARLGASRVHAIDVDADAVECARGNLVLNPDARNVTVAIADLSAVTLPISDVVLANLTGATLVRSAGRLLAAAGSEGTLILSGVLAVEEDHVRAAFADAECVRRDQQDEWICLMMKKS